MGKHENTQMCVRAKTLKVAFRVEEMMNLRSWVRVDTEKLSRLSEIRLTIYLQLLLLYLNGIKQKTHRLKFTLTTML